MRVLVIGGTGHIGTYLIPRLVRAGFDVVNLSRGESKPYTDLDVWAEVEQVVADRTEREADGTFSDTVAALRPDVVVDLVCFTLDSAQSLVDGLRGRVGHLLHCGSVWRYGPSLKLPIREGEGSPPADEYGIQKDRIARMLIAETAATGFATTSVHPGHIVGPGWAPIGPLGNASLAQWRPISAGHTVEVPGSGAELMHHVHADDVAQLFQLAIDQRDRAAGQDFHAVAPSALTVRGYLEAAAAWFGHEGSLRTVSWEHFRSRNSDEDSTQSWDHLHRSHCLSIFKSQTLLGYEPAHEPEEAILESVRWLIEQGQLEVAGPLQL